jgi:hypothetical protein
MHFKWGQFKILKSLRICLESRINGLPVSATRWWQESGVKLHNFYLAKNQKIASNSTTTEVREKICTDLEL